MSKAGLLDFVADTFLKDLVRSLYPARSLGNGLLRAYLAVAMTH